MNIEQAKAIPLYKILYAIGFGPVTQSIFDLWYLSPFRAEETASFHVNREKNVWFDFGENVGGNALDFACHYLKVTREDYAPADALRWLENMVCVPERAAKPQFNAAQTQSSLALNKAPYEIKHPALVEYLKVRHIPIELARHYVKEASVHNRKTGRNFVALAFGNDADGYELRNVYFKGCLPPKNISFIRGVHFPIQEVHVFEGFIDFLSALALRKQERFKGDVIVLNSTYCLPQALPYIQNYTYKTLYSWLDNDVSGERAAEILRETAEKEPGMSFRAMNRAYAKHKDVNAWLSHKPKM